MALLALTLWSVGGQHTVNDEPVFVDPTLPCIDVPISWKCPAAILGVCNQNENAVIVSKTDFLELQHLAVPANSVGRMPADVFAKANWGAIIPVSHEAREWGHHRMSVRSAGGEVKFDFWNNDCHKMVVGGRNYGSAVPMTTVCGQEERFNVVVNKAGNVSLWLATDWQDCPSPTPDCKEINDKQGSWVAISSTSVEAQISVTEGVTRGYEISDTQSWSLSVTESISGGFSANGASGTIGISGTEAVTISHTYSSTFAQSKSTTETMGPFQPGTIWQWQWIVGDVCGTSVIQGHDLVSTQGSYEPPCCLPGYFKDPANPRGECAAGKDGQVFNLCAAEVVV